MSRKHTDIATVVSTMSTLEGHLDIGQYTWYFAPREKDNHSTGVAIAVLTQISQNYTSRISIVQEGRILLLRLQKRNQDLSIIAAYAYGEHYPM